MTNGDYRKDTIMDFELFLDYAIVFLPVIFFVIGFLVGRAVSLKFDGYLHVIDTGEGQPSLLLDIPSIESVEKEVVVLKTLKGDIDDER